VARRFSSTLPSASPLGPMSACHGKPMRSDRRSRTSLPGGSSRSSYSHIDAAAPPAPDERLAGRIRAAVADLEVQQTHPERRDGVGPRRSPPRRGTPR
jgi:hypothetical protein